MNYTWLPLTSTADLDRLVNEIPVEYGPKAVVEKLKKGLSAEVKAVLIEHGYVDKDYRSTYYHFYAKKGQAFRSDRVRLHFHSRLPGGRLSAFFHLYDKVGN